MARQQRWTMFSLHSAGWGTMSTRERRYAARWYRRLSQLAEGEMFRTTTSWRWNE